MSDTAQTGPWQETRYGKKFDVTNPRAEDVSIVDIAHQLARSSRFNGATHTDIPYSIAQHSVLVSMLCTESLCGLLHDAAEAYMGDIVRPVKRELSGVRNMEQEILKAVFEEADVPPAPDNDNSAFEGMRGKMREDRKEWYTWLPFINKCRDRAADSILSADVIAADNIMLVTEHDQLFGPQPLDWEWDVDVPRAPASWVAAGLFIPWTAQQAEQAFLRSFSVHSVGYQKGLYYDRSGNVRYSTRNLPC